MAWLLLIVAGLCEIVWAIGLKYAEGFTRFWPSVITVVAMLVSIVLLGFAMKSLPVGTSYAVWVGVGAVGESGPARQPGAHRCRHRRAQARDAGMMRALTGVGSRPARL